MKWHLIKMIIFNQNNSIDILLALFIVFCNFTILNIASHQTGGFNGKTTICRLHIVCHTKLFGTISICCLICSLVLVFFFFNSVHANCLIKRQKAARFIYAIILVIINSAQFNPLNQLGYCHAHDIFNGSDNLLCDHRQEINWRRLMSNDDICV